MRTHEDAPPEQQKRSRASWLRRSAKPAFQLTALLNDDTELFKQFSDNESFRRWLTDTVFDLTYAQPQAENQMTALD